MDRHVAAAIVSCVVLGALAPACAYEDVPAQRVRIGRRTSYISEEPASDETSTVKGTDPIVASQAATSAAVKSTATLTALGSPKQGISTWYDADGGGNCGFAPSPKDLMVVAPNKAKYYAGSAICGGCMKVTGPKGSIVVRVVDSCPINQIPGDCGTSGADIDLSEQAFAKIDDLDNGVSHVTFQLVACNVTGSMSYRFKSGSSRWWTGIQVQNHRVPVAKLEVRTSTSAAWLALPREDDDYFIATKGLGDTPNGIYLRITASTGDVVEDKIAGVISGQTVPGNEQL